MHFYSTGVRIGVKFTPQRVKFLHSMVGSELFTRFFFLRKCMSRISILDSDLTKGEIRKQIGFKYTEILILCHACLQIKRQVGLDEK